VHVNRRAFARQLFGVGVMSLGFRGQVGAQSLVGVLPAQRRPRTLGEIAADTLPSRFSPYTGPILGEHFAIGNVASQPHGEDPSVQPTKWLFDVLPQKAGATGTYQLAMLEELGVWQLVNDDRTLASLGDLTVGRCEATLTLKDATGQFAEIVASRDGSLHDETYTPIRLRVKQGGRSYRAAIRVIRGRRALVPDRFTLNGPDGRAAIRFDDTVVVVEHRSPRAFDERTLTNVVVLVWYLPILLSPTPARPFDNVFQRC
jgi:hypothetical protein